MSTHSDSINCFCDEMRRHPEFSKFADGFRTDLTGIDRLADDSPDHAEFFDGLEFIFSQRWRSLDERLSKMVEFTKLTGNPVVCVMREFVGW
jgi:hypothetical protein